MSSGSPFKSRFLKTVMRKVIARGAEAVLYLERMKAGGEETTALVKERLKKGYRFPELDRRIRLQRTRHEEGLIARARRVGVLAPAVLDTGDFTISMEYIEGSRVKDCLNGLPKPQRVHVYSTIGDAAARLHSSGVIHGDMTTSNMILKGTETVIKSGKAPLYVIDFGLGKFSRKPEDQAVDLYVLYEALKSTHFIYLEEAWANVLKVYKQKYPKANEVINRIDKIKQRRRYLG